MSVLAGGLTEARKEFGTPGIVICRDCGRGTERVLIPQGGGCYTWETPSHECAAREARLARERAAEEEARLARLRNPDPARIRQVFERCGLPRFTQPGLDGITPREGQRDAYELLLEHRAEWQAGKRPERGLWLIGEPDVGKSYLLAAFLWDVAHWTDRPSLWWNLCRLESEMLKLFRKTTSAYDADAIDGAQVLALDEFPADTTPDFVAKELYRIGNGALESPGHVAPTQTLYLTGNYVPSICANLLFDERYPHRGAKTVRRFTEQVDLVAVERG